MDAPRRKKKPLVPGVIYISRVPPSLRPGKMRRLLEQHGDISNLYLAATQKTREEKRKYGRSKRFVSRRVEDQKRAPPPEDATQVEGWVEFADKKIAKRVAASLNTTPIGAGRHAEDLWCLKYLRGFEWKHLTEKQAYDRKVEDQRARLASAHAAREVGEYTRLMDQRDKQSAIKKRKRAAEGEADDDG